MATELKIPMYIVNLVTSKMITFDLLPDEISEDFSANFEDIMLRGRSNSIQGYDNSGPHNVSFSVTIHEGYCSDGFISTINALKALTYPGYQGMVEPPACYIRIGTMIAMRATVRSVSVTWSGVLRDGHYTSAEVSFSLVEANEKAHSADDVQGGVW